MAFFVGQKVVCIDNTLGGGVILKEGETVPALETVYTVRAIVDWGPEYDSQLLLVEIVNPVCRWWSGEWREGAFNVRRFRPVVERKTDISIFTAMLTPKKVKEPV